MAKLCYKDPTGVKREVPLRGAAVTVGRHPGQDIQILDRVVSKEHCRIEMMHGRYSIRDVGSRNGTYINGIRISSRRPLTNGDEVSIGSTSLKFVEDKPEDALLSRVTFHDSGLESNIRSRLTGNDDRGFAPGDQIHDVDALRRDYEKLRIAVELQDSIGLVFDLEEMLNKILDQAFKIVPADRGVILLSEFSTDPNAPLKLVPKIVKTRTERESVSSIRLSQTILKEVMEEKSAVLSNDAMMDSRFSGAHSIILEQIRSTMAVPLLYKDRLLGVIHLDSQIASGAFSEQDLQILTGFARQAAFNIEHSRVVRQMEKEIVARESIKRLLPPELVEEVVQGRAEIKKGGDAREATVLFSDIRGFTSMSEKLTAQQLVDLLNAYFEVMVDVVFEYEGTLDKFVGDEIMALWGAPISIEDAAYKCVVCALMMQKALRQFNEARNMEYEMLVAEGRAPAGGYQPIHMGVGINSGQVVAGYVGSSKSLSYTVMGDVVNTASRFCSVAGPGDVIIGRDTYEEIKTRIDAVALPPAKLKGKAEAVDLFRVIGLRSERPHASEESISMDSQISAEHLRPRHGAGISINTAQVPILQPSEESLSIQRPDTESVLQSTLPGEKHPNARKPLPKPPSTQPNTDS